MPDRREEILSKELQVDEKHHIALSISDRQRIYNAMDAYMKETVLEAFEYVVKNTTGHSIESDGSVSFKYKGEWISKEQLFENFL